MNASSVFVDTAVDIAIVGGGIAGPALAAALADTGYRIALIEKDEQPPDTARGDHLQPATCELLEQWQALEPMFRRGAEKRLGSRWFDAAGNSILDVAVDELSIPHPYYLYLKHERISDALLERAAMNPGFTLIRPALARVRPGTDGIHALVVDANGATRTVDAACIIAADGRSSRIRKTLAIPADLYPYENPLVIFFMPRSNPEPRNDVQAWLTDAGVISLVPRNGGNWKVGFPVRKAELAAWTKATPGAQAQRLMALVPPLAGAVPALAGVYPVVMVTAKRWVKDNVVVIGDACHAMHPGRSQGMNVALKAIGELASRLASVGPALRPGDVAELLAGYDAAVRPELAPQLAENHERGLAMDRMDAAANAKLADTLKTIAADPDKRRAYALNSAGY